jgi:3'-phosphoadenosine 5'-phosphosulfate sulfotransferase (PAPS reductase)/FAD synthetase
MNAPTRPLKSDLSAYTLPEGNVQIAFSGGRTSAYMLHQIMEANGGLPDRARVIFTNTGREMPETLDFVQECADRWAVHVTWLEYRARQCGNRLKHSFVEVDHASANRDGLPMIDVMRYFGYPPNREADFCSHELKTRTAKRFCVDILCWRNWTTAIGIRSDEDERVLEKQPRERYRVWYPLNNAKATKDTVATFWRAQPFGLRLQTVNGVTPFGNCDGCFKKSEWKRAVLARDHPERAQWWADQELRFGGTFLKADPWAQKIDYIDRQGAWIFDAEDALCQANDGECTG